MSICFNLFSHSTLMSLFAEFPSRCTFFQTMQILQIFPGGVGGTAATQAKTYVNLNSRYRKL
jgi:hypothetical protein